MVVVDWITMVSLGEGETACGCLRKAFRQCKGYIKVLMIGELFGLYIVEFLKATVGEPRPDFWHTCGPNITQQQCDQG